ncbi:hypothetical protein PLICRDRAFT_42163 [Plicaturopsis crispa FD-325 SS-3]|nr:hypothetical protein PLICRDRAFT_42163 [Plicaturopsis crispa FD-325 SS-3]
MTRQLLESEANTVLAACRSPDTAEKLHALKATSKGTLHIVQLDVDDESSIKDAAEKAKSLVGPNGIDYLVNNAAISEGDDYAFSFAVERLNRYFHTNVIGPVLVSQNFLPLVEKSKKKTIVNMSSGLGCISFDIGPKYASYSLTKAALNMMAYKQARERPDLTILLIDPGWVKTDMGGEDAEITLQESVPGILKVITTSTPASSGKYYRYDGTEMGRQVYQPRKRSSG